MEGELLLPDAIVAGYLFCHWRVLRMPRDHHLPVASG